MLNKIKFTLFISLLLGQLIVAKAQDKNEILNKLSNSRQNAITDVVKMAGQAIVGINITEVYQYTYRDPFYDDPFFSRFFGSSRPRVRQQEVHGLGSGFIISPDGYILTNHHVAGNASKIVVTLTSGKKYDAEIIGSDRTSDVALLKIKADNLPFLQCSNSDDVITGEWVVAFGNPFGLFDMNAKPTVTVGVVSNKGINFMHEDRVYRDMIQTDAAISSGNSGGPLLNVKGEVIGMNTVIFSTAQSQSGSGSIGIGFSIPINRIQKVVQMLKSGKKIEREFFTGLEIREIDETVARYLKLDTKEGIVVFSIQRRSPAEESGLEPGDIITEVNGVPVLRDEEFLVYVNDSFAGDYLNFTIKRDGQILQKKLYLKPLTKKGSREF